MGDPSAGRHLVLVILVVDDDKGVRAVIRRTLEGAGYQVQEAADGVEALAVLRQGGVDAVVTDIRMPGMDGWELAAHLRSMTPQLPILLMSGYDTQLRSRNLPGPMLAKPFRPEQLLDCLRRLLVDNSPQSAEHVRPRR